MKVFVDTSAWLALADKSDQYQNDAIARLKAIKDKRIILVTSDYIVDESITIVRFRVSHDAALKFGESLFTSRIINLISIEDHDRIAAWNYFKKYSDKKFSYTDCTSFALMKRMRIEKAFSFDDHFIQAGFSLL